LSGHFPSRITYISVRIRDWIIGQQQKRNTVHSAAFEFGDPD
jgi:hypothetical protein